MAKVLTDDNYPEFLENNKNELVVVFCDGQFCDNNAAVDVAKKDLLESNLKDKIVVGYLNCEDCNEFATEYDIESVPIVICIYKGKVVKRINTVEPNKLIASIAEALEQNVSLDRELGSGEEEQQNPKEKFKKYLKKLVNRSPIMIFMKGEPKQPRCGFSKQLIELLSKYNLEYDTFDILLDEDVRQGLKELSDWPTYPQIYVKGEFVGGLDILKQLHETGELESTLKI